VGDRESLPKAQGLSSPAAVSRLRRSVFPLLPDVCVPTFAPHQHLPQFTSNNEENSHSNNNAPFPCYTSLIKYLSIQARDIDGNGDASDTKDNRPKRMSVRTRRRDTTQNAPKQHLVSPQINPERLPRRHIKQWSIQRFKFPGIEQDTEYHRGKDSGSSPEDNFAYISVDTTVAIVSEVPVITTPYYSNKLPKPGGISEGKRLSNSRGNLH